MVVITVNWNKKSLQYKIHLCWFALLQPESKSCSISSTVLYKNSYCYIVIYTFMHHNNTTSKTDAWRKTPEGRHRKISLTTFYLSFYCKGSKGLFKVACERVLETEHKLIYFDPTVMTVTLCLSCSLRCSTRGLGVHSIGLFRGPPRSGVAFLTTSGLWLSGNLLATAWHPELNWVK